MKTLTSFLENAFPFKVEVTNDETGETQAHEFQDENALNRFVEGLLCLNDITVDIFHNGELIRQFGTIGEFWQ